MCAVVPELGCCAALTLTLTPTPTPHWFQAPDAQVMARIAKFETLVGERWETYEMVGLLLRDPDGRPTQNNEPWSMDEFIDRCIEDRRLRALTGRDVGPTGDDATPSPEQVW